MITSSERGTKSSEETGKAFISSFSDGHVEIEGGLIFDSKTCFWFEQGDRSGIGHKYTGMYFMGATPRWYQFMRWFRLIRLIRSYAPPK